MNKYKNMNKKWWSLFIIAIVAVVVLVVSQGNFTGSRDEKTLNLLGWIGYDEEALIKPFEEKYGVKVNVKTYIGADEMFSIMSQTRGEYDLLVIDPEFIEKLYSAGRLQKLNPSDYDFSNFLEPFKNLPTAYINDDLYAVVIRYGSNALVYNTKYFTPQEVASYDVLWSEKANGKIGMWDWYLPSMGVLSMANGNSANPYQITNSQFESLRQKLESLRPRVRTITGSLADLKQAFANEDIIIAPGVGNELAAYDLKKQGLPVEATVPREGGVMWIETLGIPNDSKNPELAKKFIQYAMSPEAQATLATLKAYVSGVPSVESLKILNAEEKRLLQMESPQQMTGFVNKLFVRELPKNQTEAEWQSVWENFKVR